MGLYRLLTDLGAPALALYLRRRRAKGREDSARFPERLGHPSQPRPRGPLVWCHAASVGEAMSVLSLIKALKNDDPARPILLTTGTVTSAHLLAERLPPGVIHQYIPVDRWPYVTRFLDHWRPDLALWVESELWPNLLTALRARKIPCVLLNGRLSADSFRRWSLAKGWARKLLSGFVLGLAQTEAERARFAALGLPNAQCIGNLKYAAEPLPYDDNELHRLKAKLGTRKVWLMASTHPGEDEIALAAHQKLRARWPDLLTILAPRHAVRGDKIARLAAAQGLPCARRSHGQDLAPDTSIFLADTMGEMGLFYRLAGLTCLGGSFTWGGHNPIEPAQLGCAIVFGPRMTNFAEIADDFLAHGAAQQVADAAALVEAVADWLAAPEKAAAAAHAARALTEQKHGVLTTTLRLLKPWLEKSS